MCSSAPKRRRAQAGFTLLEALIGLTLAAVASGIICDTLTGLLRRSYITMAVTSVSEESERFAAAFTQAGKTAVACSLYPDRTAYLANPAASVSEAGNLLVFAAQLPDRTLISELYEYDPAAQTLARYEGGFTQRRTLINQVAFSTGRPTAFALELGLVQAHWTVQTPYELLEFESYANPLRMH